MPDDGSAGVRVADRLEIRALVDAYAHHADRREPDGQAGVFTADAVVRLYEADPRTSAPVQIIEGHDRLAGTFADLISRYDATTYLNGQSSIAFDGDDEASAETYCLAMHLLRDGDERVLLTMSIRYLDRFTRERAGWRIAERNLVFDWTDRRPSSP